MVSLARVELGMQWSELKKLSPRFFAKLIDMHWDRCKRTDRMLEVMAAQIIAMVANTGFKGWDEARKPEEFMPSEWSKPKPRQRMTRKRRSEIADAWRTQLRLTAENSGQVITREQQRAATTS